MAGHRILAHAPGEGLLALATIDEARAALARQDWTLWADFDGRSPESDALLEQVFGFHPLAIEDVYKDGHRPKLEEYERYAYVIVQALARDAGWDLADIELSELDLFLGANFVVTQHDRPLAALDQTFEALRTGRSRALERGPAFVLHAVLDGVIDRYRPLAHAYEVEIDQLEARVLRGDDGASLARILDLIRGLNHLRRVAIPQRELLGKLARAELPTIPADAKPFFRDVHEHFVQFTDNLEIEREDLGSVFSAFYSLAAHRMNEVMKLLTLISTIMLPLTFIAGVYGMNFDHMPELRWRWGYALVLALMGAVAAGMVWAFRRRRWL